MKIDDKYLYLGSLTQEVIDRYKARVIGSILDEETVK